MGVRVHLHDFIVCICFRLFVCSSWILSLRIAWQWVYQQHPQVMLRPQLEIRRLALHHPLMGVLQLPWCRPHLPCTPAGLTCILAPVCHLVTVLHGSWSSLGSVSPDPKSCTIKDKLAWIGQPQSRFVPFKFLSVQDIRLWVLLKTVLITWLKLSVLVCIFICTFVSCTV